MCSDGEYIDQIPELCLCSVAPEIRRMMPKQSGLLPFTAMHLDGMYEYGNQNINRNNKIPET